mmetsp:Transcript_9810/g.16171  ORF Transcript_9810/g.16171 Transcript_9810/m.16171 type:complete len:498 (-) Transcript_9810:1588-3081(-)
MIKSRVLNIRRFRLAPYWPLNVPFSTNPKPPQSPTDKDKRGDILHQIQDTVAANVASGMEKLKGTMIQVMAQRMTEKDMVEMANHWGKKLSSSDALPTTKQDTLSTTPDIEEKSENSSAELTIDISGSTLKQLQEDLGSVSGDVDLYHPILGEQIADLGYKKLYTTNVRSLVLAPVWKKQRILRPERAALIANDKIKNKMGSSLSGSIVMYMDRATQRVGIVDGQHRVGALMILAQRGYWNETTPNIVVEVFQTNTDVQIATLFREINAAEPVRLLDLLAADETMTDDDDDADDEVDDADKVNDSSEPNANEKQIEKNKQKTKESAPVAEVLVPVPVPVAAGGRARQPPQQQPQQKQQPPQLSPAEAVKVLNAATDALQRDYAVMFKPSSRCRPPHVNIDVLRDELFTAGFLKRRRHVRTADQLVQELLNVNRRLQERYAAENPHVLSIASASTTSLEKDQEEAVVVAEVSKSTVNALRKADKHKFFLGMDRGWYYQ